MKFNERLKQKRVLMKMTQDQLAEKLHVTRQAISNWERGITEPDLDMLMKISEVLNFPVQELIAHPSPKPDPHWKKIIFFVILLLVCIIIHINVYPDLKETARTRYNLIPTGIYNYCLVPIFYLLLGITFSSFIEHWIPPLSKKAFFLLSPILIYGIAVILLFTKQLHGYTGYLWVQLFFQSFLTPVVMVLEGFLINLLFRKKSPSFK